MNGILNVLKPPGMTSHDVVSYVRKAIGIKKVGHTGTLDPGAAGVLPVCIGKATKIVDYIMDDKKKYICELTLGNRTDTYDKYGEFKYDKPCNTQNITFKDVEEVIEGFRGEILQRPPAYSAIKIEGVRAYALAREGREIDIPPRKVWIYGISILKMELPRIMLEIECSKGTYIRSICNDIGEELGCGAYMSFLIRTQTGNFTLANSCLLEDINCNTINKLILGTEEGLNMKEIFVDEKYTERLLNGNSILLDNKIKPENNELVKIFIKPDKFTAIGRISNSFLQVEKLLV